MNLSPWALNLGQPRVPSTPPTPFPDQPGLFVSQTSGYQLAQSRRASRRLLVAAGIAVLIATVVSTAAITYAITRAGIPSAHSVGASTPAPLKFSAADEKAAKDDVCNVFEMAVRGKEGQGGIVVNGELNVPLMLRKLNGVGAVQNALVPATPAGVRNAAEKFIDTSYDLMAAATTGEVDIDELRQLTEIGNAATYAFADVCGVPH